MIMYVDYVYEVVKMNTDGMDAIYQDYILELVGSVGFGALIDQELLECCAEINGRKLYTLCDKKNKHWGVY